MCVCVWMYIYINRYMWFYIYMCVCVWHVWRDVKLLLFSSSPPFLLQGHWALLGKLSAMKLCLGVGCEVWSTSCTCLVRHGRRRTQLGDHRRTWATSSQLVVDSCLSSRPGRMLVAAGGTYLLHVSPSFHHLLVCWFRDSVPNWSLWRSSSNQVCYPWWLRQGAMDPCGGNPWWENDDRSTFEFTYLISNSFK